MNIQGANLLSSLSGSEGLANFPQGLVGLTGDQAGFASALMEQLGILQSSLQANPDAVNLTDLQSLMAGSEGDWQQSLQNFAATFGQELPVVNKASQDIDLDETLQTLSDVLQQLQQLDTDTQSQQILPIAENIETQKETADVTPVDVITVDSEQTAEAAAAMLNSPSPVPVAPVTLPEVEGTNVTDSSDLTGILALVKKPASSQTEETRGPTEAITVNAEDSGLEFDRSISAMMARDDASGKQQDKSPAASFKSEALMGKLSADTAGTGVEGGKTPQDIVGDISRMNQVVRNDATANVPTNQPAMTKHFNDPGWHQELGDKLIWMHKQSIPSVELRLNPEHLGPVLVKIDVSQEQATVAFTAQHLAVKEAIEAAIPKLREMLSGQQLNLADVNVSQQQSDQKQPARDFFQMASDQGQRRQADADQANGVVNEAQNIVDEIEAGRAIASQGVLSLFA